MEKQELLVQWLISWQLTDIKSQYYALNLQLQLLDFFFNKTLIRWFVTDSMEGKT